MKRNQHRIVYRPTDFSEQIKMSKCVFTTKTAAATAAAASATITFVLLYSLLFFPVFI